MAGDALRVYDADEVDAYITELLAQFERSNDEIAHLRADLEIARSELAGAPHAAERMAAVDSDAMVEDARRRVEVMVADVLREREATLSRAEADGRRIVERSEREAEQIVESARREAEHIRRATERQRQRMLEWAEADASAPAPDEPAILRRRRDAVSWSPPDYAPPLATPPRSEPTQPLHVDAGTPISLTTAPPPVGAPVIPIAAPAPALNGRGRSLSRRHAKLRRRSD